MGNKRIKYDNPAMQKMQDYMVFHEMNSVTMRNYSFYAFHYLSWLKRIGISFKNSGKHHVVDFINYRNAHATTKKPLAVSSINLMKASLRTLYLANDKEEIAAGIKGKKAPEKIPNTISLDAMKTIFKVGANYYDDEYKNRRTYYLLTFLYQSGARLNEALSIKKADFDFDNFTVKVGSKGSEHLRKLDKAWLKELKAWLEKESLSKEVFVSKGRRMPTRSAQWIIERVCLEATGRAYSAHRFRASCITHRLNAGEEFFSVSSNFHKHVDTTRKYLGATARSLSRMVNPFEELGKK